MSAAEKPKPSVEATLLRELLRVMARAHASRSGPVDTSTACAILGCHEDVLRDFVKAGDVKPWPKRFGKEKLWDAASVWALLEMPKPRAAKRLSAANDEAEAISKIRID